MKTIEKKKFRKNNQKSPLLQLENDLFSKFKENRKKVSKVSALFLVYQAKKLWIYHFKYISTYKDRTFKASNSWMRRFIKRRKIKFSKNKSGKLLS